MIFTKFALQFCEQADFKALTVHNDQSKFIGSMWAKLSENEKMCFHNEKDRVNALEKKVYSEKGVFPDWKELAGDYWGTDAAEVQ